MVRFFARELPDENDFPTRFLFGFFAVNTILYLPAMLLHIPLIASVTGIFVLFAAWVIVSKYYSRRSNSSNELCQELKPAQDGLAGIICVLLALAGTTVWSRDSLTCEQPRGDVTIYKPFGDSFCHAYTVARVSAPEVPRDIVWATGVPLKLYHFASYTIPAIITKISNTSPYQAFNSIQVPLGLFLVGLAAFVLVKAWWGPWPGLAASAFIFLPDAAWLGVQNYWFSFHWMAQTGPGLSYGIALIVLSWVMMFRGCRTGRKSLVLASFVALALCAFYKYHIFVANALLLWIYPSLFMTSWERKKRLGWLGFALTTYFAAVIFANHFFSGEFPPLRIDGSALKLFVPVFVSMIEWDAARVFFSKFSLESSMLHDVAWGAGILFTCVFGLLGAAWIALSVLLGKRAGWQALLFPCLVVVNYLVMTLGLPQNTGVGEVDELVHRPFVWAYAVIAAWVGGAAYFYCFGDRRPQKPWVATALLGSFVIALVIPVFSNRIIHQGAAVAWTAKYCRIPVPTGLVDGCRFIREHGQPADVIQDSKLDPHLYAAGLTGGRSFIAGTEFSFLKSPPRAKERVPLISAWLEMDDEAKIREFASRNKIRWMILHPGDGKAWPSSMLDRCEYASDGYRIFRFF